MINRRKFMSLFAIGALGPGLVNAMSHSGTVAKVKESDDNAKALKYVEVSAVDGQNCANCVLYMASKDPGWGACAALKNNLVAENGWCIAWAGKQSDLKSWPADDANQ